MLAKMRVPIGYFLNYSGENILGLSLKSMEKKYFTSMALGFFKAEITHSSKNFNLWIRGETENNFINAGMIELKETGFLSNRMRQIVAWNYN